MCAHAWEETALVGSTMTLFLESAHPRKEFDRQLDSRQQELYIHL